MRPFRSTSAFACSMTLPTRANLFVWRKIPSSRTYIFVTLTVFITSRWISRKTRKLIYLRVRDALNARKQHWHFDPKTLSCHCREKSLLISPQVDQNCESKHKIIFRRKLPILFLLWHWIKASARVSKNHTVRSLLKVMAMLMIMMMMMIIIIINLSLSVSKP